MDVHVSVVRLSRYSLRASFNFCFSSKNTLKQVLAIVMQQGIGLNLGWVTDINFLKLKPSTNLEDSSSRIIISTNAFLHSSKLNTQGTSLPLLSSSSLGLNARVDWVSFFLFFVFPIRIFQTL